jgi:photosystem II stability/assembly factor-like uncharacterized protein
MSAHGARWGWLALAASLAMLLAGAALTAQTRRPTTRPAAPAAARHPQFKAIFEPVNESAEAAFTDVSFVDPWIGWASGHAAADPQHGGFIVATRDGGRTWTRQFGDPRSAAAAVERIFALDATHAWAQQSDGSIVRTTNGRGWEPIRGPGAFGPLVFVSPLRGVIANRAHGIHLTADGGRTWTQAYRCPSPGGGIAAVTFAPDRATGYALMRVASGGSVLLKTSDAGETWSAPAATVPDPGQDEASLAFTDAASGFLLAGGALSRTWDGGVTWHEVPAPVPPRASRVLFVGDVGWMVAGRTFVYTRDGGRRWNVRELDFASNIVGFSMPTADDGYVVGGSTVYRYRVVPFAYSVPRMVVIPALSAIVPGGS